MPIRVTLVAFFAVLSTLLVVSFGLQLGSTGMATDLMTNELLFRKCNETTCVGPVRVLWNNGVECKGKPERMNEILNILQVLDRCTKIHATSSQRLVNTESALVEYEYGTSDCTGPAYRMTRKEYHQCKRVGNTTTVDFENVQAYLKYEGALAMNPDGVGVPGPPLPGSAICMPGSCTNPLFMAQWGDGTSCSGTHLSEAGTQYATLPGVCYLSSSTLLNVLHTCLHSEFRTDTFIYGCTGTPVASTSMYMDTRRSNATVAATYCTTLKKFLACRNPTGPPPTPQSPTGPPPSSFGSKITLSSSIALILTTLAISVLERALRSGTWIVL